MKVSKKVIICIIAVGIVLLGDIGFNIYNNGWKEFLKINAYEVLTIVIALVVTYYLTERKNDKRKLNNKIENVCTDIEAYIREEYKVTPSKKIKKRVLTNIRYVSNKINILKKLTDSDIKINEAVKYVEQEHNKYNELVSSNLDQDESYFLEENRQEKINTYINNMDNKLDEIIVYLYTGKEPIIHND